VTHLRHHGPDHRAHHRPGDGPGPGSGSGPQPHTGPGSNVDHGTRPALDHGSTHRPHQLPRDAQKPGSPHRPGHLSLGSASFTLFLQFLLRTAWKPVLSASVLGAISGIGSAMLISMVNQAIRQSTQASSIWTFALLLTGTLVALVVSQYLLISLSQKTIAKLRLNMAEGILASRLSHLERLGEHRLLATLTSDVRSLSHSFSILPGLVADIAKIVSCLAYLAWLSGAAFVLLVLLVGGTMACVRTLMNRAHQSFALAREQEDSLIENFGSTIHGIKELKLSRERREDFVNSDLQPGIANLRASLTRAMRMFAWSEAFGQLALLSILGCLVFLLPDVVMTEPATIASFAVTVLFLMGPFLGTLRRLPDIARGSVSLQKIDSLNLSLSRDIEPMVSTEESQPLFSSCVLSFDQLVFDYPTDEEESGFCLGPVSFELQPGTITYLTGGNGSGKSTIAKLIAGLYEPDGGGIRLNNHVVTDANRDWYREHVAVVFSDFHLFNRCLGTDDRDEEIAGYLKLLELDGKVLINNGLLSTTRLSSGQRKRLALLNACLDGNRPLYVFDEWASDQDPAFRDKFYTNILMQLKQKGKTILVITHDDRYFKLADQLLTLDYGRLRTDADVKITKAAEQAIAQRA